MAALPVNWLAEAQSFHPQVKHRHTELNLCSSLLLELANLSFEQGSAEQFRRVAGRMPIMLPREAIRKVADTQATFLHYHNREKSRSTWLVSRDDAEVRYLQHVARGGSLLPGWVPQPYAYAAGELERTWLPQNRRNLPQNMLESTRVGPPPRVLDSSSQEKWSLWLCLPGAKGDTKNILVAISGQRSRPDDTLSRNLLRRAYPHSSDDPPACNADPHWHTNIVRACPLPEGGWHVDVAFPFHWEPEQEYPLRRSERLQKRQRGQTDALQNKYSI